MAIATLATGPVQLAPHVVIDIHSLIVGCFAIVIGSQLVMFSALAQKYSMIQGFLPRITKFHRMVASFTLERIMLFGILLFVIGLVGSLWAVYSWAASGFGPITYNSIMRILVISLTAIVVAVQLIASAFLTSVFEIPHLPLPERAED
jgi:hypothetical protein